MLRKALGEFIGTAMLLYVIVGSGIMIGRTDMVPALGLLINGLAVGLGLGAMIALFMSVSGAHFNPSVSMAIGVRGLMSGSEAMVYTSVQLVGAMAGVMLANMSFSLDPVTLAITTRSGMPLLLSEFVATFGLVLIIVGLVAAARIPWIPLAVGAWVAAIIVATPSTGFANPAATIARMFTDTFAGIAPASVPWFVAPNSQAGQRQPL